MIPSPVCLNNQPPCASIATFNSSSCAVNAARIVSGSRSQRRVEPSMSVNRKVTVPEGRITPGHYASTVSRRSVLALLVNFATDSNKQRLDSESG